MSLQKSPCSSGPSLPRSIRARGAALALVAGLLVGLTGCNQDEAWTTFRDAASSSLEAGANSFFDGVVSGAFAVFDLGTDNADTTGG